jgi:uncharacterized protein YceH (UPF0502 family)
MTDNTQTNEQDAAPRWRPLSPLARRVLGVLVEKAKTTPENYPLSLNAVRNGCNQKNNRSPLMQLEEGQVEEALDELRHMGAVALVQGSGRVDKYRHLAYEWLGVEKAELGVMAELLLRGAQTVGELRGRAARMEPIKDLAELRPILDSLEAKGLIQYLTPPGRGCVLTHALHRDQELPKLRQQYADAAAPSAVRPAFQAPAPASSVAAAPDAARLSDEIHRLREEIAAVKQEFLAMRAEIESTSQQLRHDLDELNRQLGV